MINGQSGMEFNNLRYPNFGTNKRALSWKLFNIITDL